MAVQRFIQAYKTRLLPAAGALFIVCSATAGPAQTPNETSELLNRINQLENQVQTMSRAVFRGERRGMPAPETAPGPGGSGSSAAAGFEVRLSQLEDQQRNLTGQIEKITFDVQKLKTSIERMQADTEQRFQQNGQSGNTAPSPDASPAGQNAPASGGKLGTLDAGEENNGPPEALYESSFALLRESKYDRAESGFRDFLAQYPDHPLASNAQYWLGETYYVRGDFKQSAKMFAQGYQSFPKSAKAHDSLLKLGLSLSRLGKKDDACISLQQLQKEISDGASPLRSRALQEIKQLGCP
jgi:tol-pal system protein YbgF